MSYKQFLNTIINESKYDVNEVMFEVIDGFENGGYHNIRTSDFIKKYALGENEIMNYFYENDTSPITAFYLGEAFEEAHPSRNVNIKKANIDEMYDVDDVMHEVIEELENTASFDNAYLSDFATKYFLDNREIEDFLDNNHVDSRTAYHIGQLLQMKRDNR